MRKIELYDYASAKARIGDSCDMTLGLEESITKWRSIFSALVMVEGEINAKCGLCIVTRNKGHVLTSNSPCDPCPLKKKLGTGKGRLDCGLDYDRTKKALDNAIAAAASFLEDLVCLEDETEPLRHKRRVGG